MLKVVQRRSKEVNGGYQQVMGGCRRIKKGEGGKDVRRGLREVRGGLGRLREVTEGKRGRLRDARDVKGY